MSVLKLSRYFDEKVQAQSQSLLKHLLIGCNVDIVNLPFIAALIAMGMTKKAFRVCAKASDIYSPDRHPNSESWCSREGQIHHEVNILFLNTN